MPKRAIALILSSLTVLVMLAAPATAAPKTEGLTMSSDATLTAGSASWLAVTWTSKKNREHFSVVVSSVEAGASDVSGITIGYPGEGSSTGLWANQILSKNEVDFTAIYVDVPADFSGETLTLNLVADGISGFALVVPVVTVGSYVGDDVVQVNDDLGTVASGDAVWADIQFLGLAPMVTDFKVIILNNDGVTIVLPQDPFTSLDADAQLDMGESDVVRLYLDATTLEAGPHEIVINTSWELGGVPKSMDSSVMLQVTATP